MTITYHFLTTSSLIDSEKLAGNVISTTHLAPLQISATLIGSPKCVLYPLNSLRKLYTVLKYHISNSLSFN